MSASNAETKRRLDELAARCVYAYEYRNGEDCTPLRVCGLDEYESKAPTRTSDRACSKHSPACSPTQFQTVAPTRFNDRVCQTAKVCTEDEYELVPLTGVTDRVCRPVTACQDGYTEAKPPTAVADR